MNEAAGKPKPAFFISVVVVVMALIAFAVIRCNRKSTGSGTSSAPIDINQVKQQSGTPTQAENPDSSGITTVSEYQFEPASRLPPVSGSADYLALDKKMPVIKFAINVWAGWAPIIHANGGKGPGKVWKDAAGNDFKVELILIDNPVNMGNAFASGDVHVGWATVDMLPLLVERFNRDPRTMPRVFQQIDWSNGGDGIVVRDDIKSVADLRGKTVVLAQNSPSHYFLLNVLLNGGVQPSEVKMRFTTDAFQAAAAFYAAAGKTGSDAISAVVSWAPDIYNLEKVKGNRMLVNTLVANKLIADVWFARADFARDRPEIVEGLVRGIFDSITELKQDVKKQDAAKLLDDVFDLPPGTGLSMMGDAHWTNYAENRDFFLNQNNPSNFERTYNTAFLLYKAIRAIDKKVPFDQLVDFSIIKKLAAEEKYASQKNEYEFKFTPVATEAINLESTILTKTVVINFFPNSFDLYREVPAKNGGGQVLYDPNVNNTVEEVAKLAGQFGAARIVITGHSDASMKGIADERLVKELSTNRAKAVMEALVNKYKLSPSQFAPEGKGWSVPADPADPSNHAKNRRVEVRVVPAEAQ
jgi:NitT/TauT family transport system substrate-binding protein